MEPVLPALAGRFFTTEPPGKTPLHSFYTLFDYKFYTESGKRSKPISSIFPLHKEGEKTLTNPEASTGMGEELPRTDLACKERTI